MHFESALWRHAEDHLLGISSGVFCHVYLSSVQELPWELALTLRSSSSECTLAFPWQMPLLGFPVRQENNGICWIKLIMPARNTPLCVFLENSSTHENMHTTETHNVGFCLPRWMPQFPSTNILRLKAVILFRHSPQRPWGTFQLCLRGTSCTYSSS